MIHPDSNIHDLVASLPDSVSETKLASLLRSLPGETARREVFGALRRTDGRRRIALIRAISRSSNDPTFLLEILDFGFRLKLASEIGGWIRYLIPKIGMKRAVSKLQSYVGIDNDLVDMAVYHLRGQAQNFDKKAIRRLNDSLLLQRSLENKDYGAD